MFLLFIAVDIDGILPEILENPYKITFIRGYEIVQNNEQVEVQLRKSKDDYFLKKWAG